MRSGEKLFILDGGSVDDLDSFWAAVGRTILTDGSWERSLPGFDDALASRAEHLEGATVRWLRVTHARHSLGREATLRWLRDQAGFSTPEKAELVAREIGRAERGKGPMLFDMLNEAMRRNGLFVVMT